VESKQPHPALSLERRGKRNWGIIKIKMPGGGLPGEVNSLWGVSIMNSWCKINRWNK
jgi:hypothetical protein